MQARLRDEELRQLRGDDGTDVLFDDQGLSGSEEEEEERGRGIRRPDGPVYSVCAGMIPVHKKACALT